MEIFGVIISPCSRCLTLALWYHFISSSLRSLASWSLAACLRWTSSVDKTPDSALLSNWSMMWSKCFFSFLYIPEVCRAHPRNVWRKCRILLPPGKWGTTSCLPLPAGRDHITDGTRLVLDQDLLSPLAISLPVYFCCGTYGRVTVGCLTRTCWSWTPRVGNTLML